MGNALKFLIENFLNTCAKHRAKTLFQAPNPRVASRAWRAPPLRFNAANEN